MISDGLWLEEVKGLEVQGFLLGVVLKKISKIESGDRLKKKLWIYQKPFKKPLSMCNFTT